MILPIRESHDEFYAYICFIRFMIIMNKPQPLKRDSPKSLEEFFITVRRFGYRFIIIRKRD
jgi:hypothetical protein